MSLQQSWCSLLPWSRFCMKTLPWQLSDGLHFGVFVCIDQGFRRVIKWCSTVQRRKLGIQNAEKKVYTKLKIKLRRIKLRTCHCCTCLQLLLSRCSCQIQNGIDGRQHEACCRSKQRGQHGPTRSPTTCRYNLRNGGKNGCR